MKFELGNKAALGRKKGSKNRLTEKLRGTITAFLNKNFEKIKEDFETMPARDRAKLYCDLLGYVVPRLQSTTNKIDFEALSEDDLDIIIENLKKAG